MSGNEKINVVTSSEAGSTGTRATKLVPCSLGHQGSKVRGNCWLLFFPLLRVSVPGVAHAQAWFGILSPSRAIDWSNAGIPGGIPNRTSICATINASTYGNGSSDSTSGIQSALNNCPSGQVVSLSTGTFLVNGQLNIPSNVTLRGQGANLTILNAKGTSGNV